MSDNLFWLFVAYSFIWVVIFWYTLRLGRRQAKVAEELEFLKKSLKDKL
ncbi:MAG: CcmD family protein [Peptococcaceae bacterium]|nr:CcmD family protein [Peptococcaceae bacterium]